MDHFGILFWVTYTTYTPEKPNMDPIYVYIYIYGIWVFNQNLPLFHTFHFQVAMFSFPGFNLLEMLTPWNCWFLPSFWGASYGSPLSMVGQHRRLGESQVFLPLLGVLAERLSLWGMTAWRYLDHRNILCFLWQNTKESLGLCQCDLQWKRTYTWNRFRLFVVKFTVFVCWVDSSFFSKTRTQSIVERPGGMSTPYSRWTNMLKP